MGSYKHHLAWLMDGRNWFLRAVGILVGGSVAGHAITAAALPIATRLYAPSGFSSAATFASFVAILISVACLRFEMAIPFCAGRLEALHLLLISLISALAFSLLIGLGVFFLGANLFTAMGVPAIQPFAPLVPIAVLLGGAFLALQMWYVREQKFSKLAQARVGQSALAAASQIGFGVVGAGPVGLITAQSINYGAAAAYLLPSVLRSELKHGTLEIATLRKTFRRNAIYPRYSVIESLANMGAIHVPILIIAAKSSGPDAGFLMLAMFVLQIPMALVGKAVAQVYLSEARSALQKGELESLTWSTVFGVAKASAIPMTVLALSAPYAFPVIFGAEWSRSGTLATWMVPWFFVQLLASPVSGALHIRGRQRLAMYLHLFGMLLRIGAVLGAFHSLNGWASEVYAVSGFIFYIFYLIIIRFVSMRRKV